MQYTEDVFMRQEYIKYFIVIIEVEKRLSPDSGAEEMQCWLLAFSSFGLHLHLQAGNSTLNPPTGKAKPHTSPSISSLSTQAIPSAIWAENISPGVYKREVCMCVCVWCVCMGGVGWGRISLRLLIHAVI